MDFFTSHAVPAMQTPQPDSAIQLHVWSIVDAARFYYDNVHNIPAMLLLLLLLCVLISQVPYSSLWVFIFQNDPPKRRKPLNIFPTKKERKEKKKLKTDNDQAAISSNRYHMESSYLGQSLSFHWHQRYAASDKSHPIW